MLVTL
jgi:hypothetical protein